MGCKVQQASTESLGCESLDVEANSDLIELHMQSVPCILAAMTPCNRLYAFLGTQLAAAHPSADNPYAEWLHTYASPAFQALPQRMEALLDELGSDNDLGALHSCLPLLDNMGLCWLHSGRGGA